ncbi:unnamed protein product [Cylicocyclus nassatus]|uniref:7TM GPCR serpentine receptor class x (Srx) domain-containing protein n=1 Tax=Cylicocyclus nassatus TaxID=53992 RepID=A0AA36GKQ5_CYLNA|nr:unnamed protein product [Cylicocyclus nassatus]
MANALRLVIGAVINVEIWILLCTNIFVLFCIIKGRLHLKKDNSVHILANFNIFFEILQQILHVFYVGPAIITGKWFFEGQNSLGVTIAATWFLGLWYLGSLVQMLFATNRFVVICFPSKTFFTRSRVFKFIILSCCAAAGMVTYSQILSPCCRITPDPNYFGYSYLITNPNAGNPSMYRVDLPLDITTSAYCGLSYIALFAYVLKVGAPTDARSKRELRCCVQFLLMFLTYTITWLTFFVYPVIGIPYPEAYAVTTVVFMSNCGINSIIYLVMNREVRRVVNEVFGRKGCTNLPGTSAFSRRARLSSNTNEKEFSRPHLAKPSK